MTPAATNPAKTKLIGRRPSEMKDSAGAGSELTRLISISSLHPRYEINLALLEVSLLPPLANNPACTSLCPIAAFADGDVLHHHYLLEPGRESE